MKQLIEMTGVTKDFLQGDNIINALKETNFTAYEGELIGIVGPSGIGKSTLIKMLLGELQPVSGEIKVNGMNLQSLDLKAFLSRVAVLPQEIFLIFTLSVRFFPFR